MKKPMFYRLEGHAPVPCHVMEMAFNNLETDWHVGFTEIGNKEVSTVFLGIDTDIRGEPALFETAVFTDGKFVEIFGRCSTWDQAEAMHKACVTLVEADLK